MGKMLIKNGKIWDGEKFFDADVLMENGKIQSISKQTNFDGEFVYDAKGAIVSAGLIDAHTHIRHISTNVLGIDEWACFPFGVVCAVDAWAEQFNEQVEKSRLMKTLVFLGTIIENNHICLDRLEELYALWQGKAIGVKVCFDTAGADVKDITAVKEAVADRKSVV